MLGTPAGGSGGHSYPLPSVSMAAEILASASAVAANQHQQYSLPKPQVPQQPPAPPSAAAAAAGSQQAAAAAAAATQQYMLQWHEHHASFFQLMEELCQSQAMTDVTVACGDVSLEAHSLILSASSPILRSILAKGGAGWPGRKQTLHFMDMNPSHMQLLLQYMYRGEVNVPGSQLGPLMQSAKALQIKGLCSSNQDEKFNDFSAAHQHLFNNTQAKGAPPTINVPSVPTIPSAPPPMVTPGSAGVGGVGAGGGLQHGQVPQPFDQQDVYKKKRKSDWNHHEDEDAAAAAAAAVNAATAAVTAAKSSSSSSSSNRRRSKSSKKSNNSLSPNVQSPTSTSGMPAAAAAAVAAAAAAAGAAVAATAPSQLPPPVLPTAPVAIGVTAAAPMPAPPQTPPVTAASVAAAAAAAASIQHPQLQLPDHQMLVPKVEIGGDPAAAGDGGSIKISNEIGMVIDEDLASTPKSGILGGIHDQSNDDPLNGSSSTSMENWSEQPTLKVKGHRIPVLPKPLSQMKTTETRSYLSRLIWATNDWKRPQYGNPETQPIWWPNQLLKWAEMKKMGGKKSAGLTNVNYNEIQKNILHEGYKYFGFDPETLWTNVPRDQLSTGGNGAAAAAPELTRTQEKLGHMMDNLPKQDSMPSSASGGSGSTPASQ